MTAISEVVADEVKSEEALLRDAIGRNASFYLSRWEEMRARRSNRSWNWPACLLNLYWFAWRKMWGPLALLILAFVILGVIGTAGARAGQLTFLASIGLSFVTGAYGNHLYLRRCERLIAATSDMDPVSAREWLRRRGGTSSLALAIALGLTFLFVALLIAGQMA